MLYARERGSKKILGETLEKICKNETEKKKIYFQDQERNLRNGHAFFCFVFVDVFFPNALVHTRNCSTDQI